jgi:hypothetical protein
MSIATSSDLAVRTAHAPDRSDAIGRSQAFDASVIIPAKAGDRGDRAAAVAVEAAQRLRAMLDLGRPHEPPGLVILELRMAQQRDGLWVAKGRRIDGLEHVPIGLNRDALQV